MAFPIVQRYNSNWDLRLRISTLIIGGLYPVKEVNLKTTKVYICPSKKQDFHGN